MEVKIYSRFNRPKDIPNPGGGRRITVTAGYIPMEVQINNLIRAGKKLQATREEQYDFPDGKVIEDYLDITRNPNFDFADASRINMELKMRIRERAKARLLEKEKIEKENKEKKDSENKKDGE